MSPEEKSYKAAQAQILEAIESGKTGLMFRSDTYKALKKIPPEIVRLQNLTSINLDQTQITDGELKILTQLENLSSLFLRCKGIRGEGISYLTELPNLQSLYLDDTLIGDEYFKIINKLVRLRSLSADRTKITDNALNSLALYKLNSLSLNQTAITDKGVTYLIGYDDLSSLHLAGTRITDVGISDVTKSANLSNLSLSGTLITDSGLNSLDALGSLKSLAIGHTRISDNGLINLRGVPQLTGLWINSTKVTSSGLKSLTELPNLNTLSLHGTPLADKDFSPLESFPEVQTLFAGYTGLGDIGASRLNTLGKLQFLSINSNPITEIFLLNLSLGSEIAERLKNLNINKTSVSDLKPILLFNALEKGVLSYDNTPCLDNDEQLRRISQITDAKHRAKETFRYLRDAQDAETPPGSNPPPQQAPFYIQLSADGKFELKASSPSQSEIDDNLKRQAHNYLRNEALLLSRLGGNRYPWVSELAFTLHNLLDREFNELNILEIYLAVECLRGIYQRRNEGDDEERLTQPIATKLDQLLTIGPGLVLDNEDVEKLELRRNRHHTQRQSPDIQNNISNAIVNNSDLFGDVLLSYSKLMSAHSKGNDSVITAQTSLNRSTIICVGLYVAEQIIAGPLGDIGNHAIRWLLRYQVEISLALPGWGDAVRVWLTPIIMRAREIHLSSAYLVRTMKK